MKRGKKYFTYIDLIRLFACISIFLYHLGLLKGGYLAVCVFFVLSGYLSFLSAFNNKNFSFKNYYLRRIKKLYIPLIIIVFTTIGISTIFSNLGWFNLKLETTSVLFGYNNYWQLSSNMDYFSMHNNSPFIHLWYISILIQLDLIFPVIYYVLIKIKDKFNKITSSVLIIVISILSFLYFTFTCFYADIMVTYYSTFTRAFSWFMGISLGYIYSNFKFKLSKKYKKKSNIKKTIYFYLLLLTTIFIFVDANSKLFLIFMPIVSLITCRLIQFSSLHSKKKLSKKELNIKYISEMSYEIYLIQYPVIYFFQYFDLENYLKIPLICVAVILLSYILHFSLNNKNIKYKKQKYISLFIVLIISLYGFCVYILIQDNTKQMKDLEQQLLQNEEKINQNKENYNNQLKIEQDKWETELKKLEIEENNIKDLVIQLPLVGIGDSVMLGAIEELHSQFPNSYIDAEVSRSILKTSSILEELNVNNMLGNPIIINLGSNGDCSYSCKKEIMAQCGNKQVFWLNTTNNFKFNDNLLSFASEYSNLHVIDWNSISKGHEEYFYADGIHLTGTGRKVYVETIYNEIYQTYLTEYNLKKEEILKEHEQEKKNKINFYGNGILLNAYDHIYSAFSSAQFVVNQDFTFETLKEQINHSLLNNTLSYKIVFVFNSDLDLSEKEYQELINMCDNHEIYIVAVNKNLNELNSEKVHIIDFYSKLKEHDDYLLADKKHLTENGNEQLTNYIKEFLM